MMDLNVCPCTLKRACFNARPRLKVGKPAQKKWLSAVHAKKRLEFAKAYVKKPDWFWRHWRFSDETHHHHNARDTAYVIRGPGERDAPDCTQKKLPKGS